MSEVEWWQAPGVGPRREEEMMTKPVVLLLAVACVAAAGGGAYMAIRQNAAAPVTAGVPAAPAPAAANADLPAPPAPSTDTVVALDDESAAPARGATPAREAGGTPGSGPRARRSTRSVSAPVNPLPAPEPAPAPAVTTPAPELPAPVLPAERVERARDVEPPPPPARTFEELTVAADAVIGLQMESTVTTERARVEDRVEARVTRDVTVGDRTAIPAGARVIGSVTLVDRGGKVRERARLGVRFHTLVLADGTTVPVQTEPVFRDGDSPAGESAAKIGGAAVGGAILGAIMGGKRGAIVGGTTGAAGGTAAVMAGDRKPAILTAGSNVTVRLSAPVTVTVER
jgi:hypothetical protein